MPVDSELNWTAYKEIVAASQDKSLELFATRKVGAHLTIDLNRPSSPHVGDEPIKDRTVDEYDVSMSQPPMSQFQKSPIHDDRYEEEEIDGDDRYEEEEMDGDDRYEEEEMDGDDQEGDEAEHGLHENDIGDVEANCLEEDMDHDLPYLRSHASDSEDEGPGEDVDEDGLTAREAEAHMKVVGRNHRPSLFRDLSLADEAKVDGGTSRVLEIVVTKKVGKEIVVFAVAEVVMVELAKMMVELVVAEVMMVELAKMMVELVMAEVVTELAVAAVLIVVLAVAAVVIVVLVLAEVMMVELAKMMVELVVAEVVTELVMGVVVIVVLVVAVC
jgi:hypothetical protein